MVVVVVVVVFVVVVVVIVMIEGPIQRLVPWQRRDAEPRQRHFHHPGHERAPRRGGEAVPPQARADRAVGEVRVEKGVEDREHAEHGEGDPNVGDYV